MKIASIVGARPQFIKLAPFSREIRKRHREVLIDTGQHYDAEMAGNFFSEFKIPKPDHALGIGSADHGEQTGKMLIALEKVLIAEQPALAVVFGDTNSTLAGALAAAKLNIPVAHVEAGLRSYDTSMPEELNRVLTDHLSKLLFCPTDVSKDNLKREGITEGVHVVGDVMVDALEESKKAADKHSKILEHFKLKKGEYQFLTVHRPSNTDVKKNLEGILKAVGDSGVTTVFSVHPRTAKLLEDYDLGKTIPKNVITTKPLGHMDAIWLVSNAARVLTDSGGLQKEAYLLGTPCITLRDNTEWVETINARWNVLVGADPKKIKEAIAGFSPPAYRPKVFGPAGASARIAQAIDSFLKGAAP
ncbi:MAG: UDP-N-acetylglucosamine 2-epimerase (non-hydrolyzing) [Candidatus Thermoplasmatota archaeon]|nr:UDP-N-acetylglucosamine 2-epimerase (non-hydrolyzing) [Candidatus Thermoplasmatota archaeon]